MKLTRGEKRKLREAVKAALKMIGRVVLNILLLRVFRKGR